MTAIVIKYKSISSKDNMCQVKATIYKPLGLF